MLFFKNNIFKKKNSLHFYQGMFLFAGNNGVYDISLSKKGCTRNENKKNMFSKCTTFFNPYLCVHQIPHVSLHALFLWRGKKVIWSLSHTDKQGNESDTCQEEFQTITELSSCREKYCFTHHRQGAQKGTSYNVGSIYLHQKCIYKL